MSGTRRQRSKTENVTIGLAVLGWVLSLAQFVAGRADRRDSARFAAAAQAREDSLAAFSAAPSLEYHYWRFEGSTRRICGFFTPELALSLPALRQLGLAAAGRAEALTVIASPAYDSVRARFRRVCSSRDPLRNDAADWKFLLAINASDTPADVERILFTTDSVAGLHVALRPGDGMVIPLGVRTAGRPAGPDDYLWPDSITLAWRSARGSFARTVPVRPHDTRLIGYVMDPATSQGIVFSEPPPVRQ